MTGWEGYAVKLAEKFNCQNTYYQKEPRLDIAAASIASDFMGKDFIISSDVFEHVTPPVSRAFENVWKMLKPGGVFVLTVPYGTQRETAEHFPELNEFSIVERDGSFVLRNKTRTGIVQEFNAQRQVGNVCLLRNCFSSTSEGRRACEYQNSPCGRPPP
jgi:SAM-dependent methyltransferase